MSDSRRIPQYVRLARLLVALMALAASLLLPVASAQEATPAATPASAASREVLGRGQPAVAPGQELVLTRVVIPPGSTVAAHAHPGMQVIWVESGSVRYTVVSGELPYTTADGVEGTLGAGETMAFGPGDWYVELPGMVHIAENEGDETAVVFSSSLLPAGVPSSISAESAS